MWVKIAGGFFKNFENNVETCIMVVWRDNNDSSMWLYLSAAGRNIIFAKCRAERGWGIGHTFKQWF